MKKLLIIGLVGLFAGFGPVHGMKTLDRKKEQNKKTLFFPKQYDDKEIVHTDWSKKMIPTGVPQELATLVDYIKTPEIYTDLGLKFPRGALLYGPPGTGKTLLARAIAQTTDVPFSHASATDFMTRYQGDSKDAIRKFFDELRGKVKAAKAKFGIAFIDEIDLIGTSRGDSSGGRYTQEQLTELLVQLDGLETGRPEEKVKVDTEEPKKDDVISEPVKTNHKAKRGELEELLFDIVVKRLKPLNDNERKAYFEAIGCSYKLHDDLERAVELDGAKSDAPKKHAGFVFTAEETIKNTREHLLNNPNAFKTALEGLLKTQVKHIRALPKGFRDMYLEVFKDQLPENIIEALKDAPRDEGAPKFEVPRVLKEVVFVEHKTKENLFNEIARRIRLVPEDRREEGFAFLGGNQVLPKELKGELAFGLVTEDNSLFGGIFGSDSKKSTTPVFSDVKRSSLSEPRIFLLAATNNPEAVDTALLRPGRLGWHIYIPLPNKQGRAAIVGHYLKKVKFEGDSQKTSDYVAEYTEGWSGAELEDLVNQAGFYAVRCLDKAIMPMHIAKVLSTNKNVVMPNDQGSKASYSKVRDIITAGWRHVKSKL